MSGLKEYFREKAGEDICILNHCGHRGIKRRFAVAGFVAFLVGVISFLSCYYSFQMLFDNIWMAIPVSLLFAWIVNNIYEVLLTTLSKPVLNIRYQGVIKHLSLSLRLGFIIFFAVFVSKPLEALIFEPQLSAQVERLKASEINNAEKQLLERSARRIEELQASIRHKQLLNYPTDQIQPIVTELNQLHNDNAEALERIEFVVHRADYFVQRLQLLISGGKFSWSWIFTLLVVVLFLLPVYLKTKVNVDNPYFKDKKTVYEKIVLDHYRQFKEHRYEIFNGKYHVETTVLEQYTDAPFNTIRKVEQRDFKNQDDFLNRLYS